MWRIAFIIGLGAIPAMADAQMPMPRNEPPAEAFVACSGRSVSAGCAFQAPRGTVEGHCRIMREGRPVCVPDGHGGPLPRAASRQESHRAPRFDNDATPFGVAIAGANPAARKVGGKIPDTRQGSCFDAKSAIPCTAPGQAYFGQDADYQGAMPSYRDNRDGSVSDLVTGLVWEKAHHDGRLGYYEAERACRQMRLGGFSDWRLPEIKELFSLADFRGAQGRRVYIDDIFEFRAPGSEVLEGDQFAASHRPQMMGQTWSATKYTGVHFGRSGVEAAFFFNFLDGHIKQAPTRGNSKLFYRCVRGPRWGDNHFVDRGDGTVDDLAAALTWQKKDDGAARSWPEALAYCQRLDLAGKRDWRLPNVKELQSIVDYRKHAPALDQRYLQMSDPRGWFWSSTTHGDNIRQADYVCFGPCTDIEGLDVHGAGAQRSDPKQGDPASFGGQGGQRDEIRVRNYVRCVR